MNRTPRLGNRRRTKSEPKLTPATQADVAPVGTAAFLKLIKN